MWNYDIDYKSWSMKSDKLDHIEFNYFKEELDSYMLYSKCFSGASFITSHDTDNIYEILSHNIPKTWHYGTVSVGHIVDNLGNIFIDEFGNNIVSGTESTLIQVNEITPSTAHEYYTKYNSEYGGSLKNLFTPERAINEFMNNYYYVDLATNTHIHDLHDEVENRKIDGIRVKDGHKVLIKDQIDYIYINPSDVDLYDYELYPTGLTNSLGEYEYKYYSSENGIYTVVGDKLIKDTEVLSIYENCIRYSIICKLGNYNFDKQYHLRRLKNGYYPIDDGNTPLQFTLNNNRLLRNQVDYHNLYDVPYYDILHHGTQSVFKNGLTYSIPERTISVGEFGLIINNQFNISNDIRNKYKLDLYDITETSNYYWAVGEENIILKIDKITFTIEKIVLDCPCEVIFKSISFFSDIRGIAVGTNNTIFSTEDGGIKWKEIKITSFDAFNYNKVYYKNNYTFYIIGDNGVFIEFKSINNEWKPYKKRISKYDDHEDEFLLLEDINDIIPFNTSTWNLNYSNQNTNTTIKTDKDLLILVTDDSNFIIYDMNESIPYHTKFFYLDFSEKYSDINRIVKDPNSNKFFFTGYDIANDISGIFSFDINDFDTLGKDNDYSNICYDNSAQVFATLESNIHPNAMFIYNTDMYIAGNNSILEYTSINTTFNFTELDPNYIGRLKPKFLFLDYDIAEKLNFFNKDGDYILPNEVNINVGTSSNDYVYFDSLTFSSPSITYKEINWWNYWRDSLSTFEYYSNNLNKIAISSTFSYTNDNVEINFQGSALFNDINEIINIAPNIESLTASRYDGTEGWGNISAPPSNADMYLYNYIMALNIATQSLSCDVGDVINMEVFYKGEEYIYENFLVNKIHNDYAYVYTNFNENIINNIASTHSFIKIRNLNKYKTISSPLTPPSPTPSTPPFDGFIEGFNLHPISNGYKAEMSSITGYNVDISARFNNITSYYNLGTEVYTSNSFNEMVYKDSFLWFGYKPTYNILDYLEFLNPVKFYANKEYLSMPIINMNISMSNVIHNTQANDIFIYADMGVLNGVDQTELYYGTSEYHLNKIYFGENLEFEWMGYFINTFIDINTNNNIGNSRLLILDKYEIEIEDPITNIKKKFYVIECDKPITIKTNPGNLASNMDIISRRKLHQISEDLELISNIQRPWNDKEFEFGGLSSTFPSLEKDLNFKVNTDNYCKIMLSDKTTSDELSVIFYNDYKNDVVFNVTNLEEEYELNALDIVYSNQKLTLKIETTDIIDEYREVLILPKDGYTQSSTYFGYHIITDIIDDERFEISNIVHDPLITFNDIVIKTIKRDPFLNYQPIDIYDIGVDKLTNIATELFPENTLLKGDRYKLTNIDLSKKRFRLIDGLDILQLAKYHSWIYEAEISDAIIGIDDNGLVWYSGTWKCGRWFNGTWKSGVWISGDWYNGLWQSKNTKDHFTYVEIDNLHSNRYKSIWYSGRWYNGTWEDGTWRKGRWYNGDFQNGVWYDGIFNDGTWYNGEFTGGVWVNGDWKTGIFTAKNAPAYWLDGRFESGDFENGRWYNGLFGSNDKRSRFGTKAHSSRQAIWMSGNWVNGSFHSRLNLDENNNYIVSDIHKYSIWYNGNWNNGDFYGGVAYNMLFRSGTWHGGILEELDITEINGNAGENTIKITVDTPAIFNIGYEFYVVDNSLNGIYSNDYGSNINPKKYTVLYSIEDLANNKSEVIVKSVTNNTIVTGDITGELKIVSNFKSCNWKSGVWTNGIYENGIFEGGIWYNGNFHSEWSFN